MKPLLVLSAIALGMVLFLLSLFWVRLFPGTSSWTPAKAEQWAEVKDRLHNLSFAVNSPEPPRRHPNHEALRAEYDKVKATSVTLQQEFESAYSAPREAATWLKWSGISLLGVGIVLNLALKNPGT